MPKLAPPDPVTDAYAANVSGSVDGEVAGSVIGKLLKSGLGWMSTQFWNAAAPDDEYPSVAAPAWRSGMQFVVLPPTHLRPATTDARFAFTVAISCDIEPERSSTTYRSTACSFVEKSRFESAGDCGIWYGSTNTKSPFAC